MANGSDQQDSKNIRVDNLDDIAKYVHKCESQQLLTDIQINLARHTESMIHLESYFQELNARFDEQNATLQRFIESTGSRIQILENNVGRHECKKDTIIIEITKDITQIKQQLSTYQGESKWHDRLWQLGQAIVVGLVLALLVWFMKGGAIT